MKMSTHNDKMLSFIFIDIFIVVAIIIIYIITLIFKKTWNTQQVKPRRWKFTCLKMYGTGPDKENAFDFKCTDTQKKQCVCIQNTCAQPVEEEIARIEKPAFKLVRYTCATEKANFAVFVKVISVNETDPTTNEKRATAELTKMVHTGTNLHLPGDQLDFAWKAYCSHPNLENGRSYYIIGKDDQYPYRLMDTALVIQLPEDTSGKREKYLAAVLRKYEQIMLLSGCMN